jgi:hypothetical protein
MIGRYSKFGINVEWTGYLNLSGFGAIESIRVTNSERGRRGPKCTEKGSEAHSLAGQWRSLIGRVYFPLKGRAGIV